MKQTRETLDEEMGKREGGWGKKAFARLSIALISGYMVPRREGGWVCLKYTMGAVHATSRIC